MEGFEKEIDTELFSGLSGGSGFFYGLFPKKVEHPWSRIFVTILVQSLGKTRQVHRYIYTRNLWHRYYSAGQANAL